MSETMELEKGKYRQKILDFEGIMKIDENSHLDGRYGIKAEIKPKPIGVGFSNGEINHVDIKRLEKLEEDESFGEDITDNPFYDSILFNIKNYLRRLPINENMFWKKVE